MKHILTILLLAAGFAAFAQPGSIDTTFNHALYARFQSGLGITDYNSYTGVGTIVRQPDGKLLVAGDFQEFNSVYTGGLIRLNADGSIDPTFQLGHPSIDVVAIVVQPDGKILLGGFFTHYFNEDHKALLRLNPDGSIDPTFDIGTGVNDGNSGWVTSLVLQPDGQVLVAGNFTTFNGTSHSGIVRLSNTGSVDNTFNTGTGFDGAVNCLFVQADGSLLAGGAFNSYNGFNSRALLRLTAAGDVDTTFHSGISGNEHVNCIDTLLNGKLVVAGSFDAYDSAARSKIALIHADGSLDGSFAVNDFNGDVYAIQPLPNGELLIGGAFFTTDINNYTMGRIRCVDSTGALSATLPFGNGATDPVRAFVLLPDGQFITGGAYSRIQEVDRPSITRFLSNGAVDRSFLPVPGAYWDVNQLIQLPGNRMLVAGGFQSYNDFAARGLVLVNADGTPDTTMQVQDSISIFERLVQLPDGNYLATVYGTFDGEYQRKIVRLLSDWTIDPSFALHLPPGDQAGDITLQPDGRFLLTGTFPSMNLNNGSCVIRLDAAGNIEPGFVLDPIQLFGNMYAVAVADNGNIFVGGEFSSANNCSSLVGYTPDGVGFLNICGGTIHKILPLSDGRVLLGGDFDDIFFYNSSLYYTSAGLLMLNADYSIDTHFVSTTPLDVQDMVMLPNGQIMVSSFGSPTPVLRFHADGTLDSSFSVPATGAILVKSLLVQTDGQVVAGGSFLGHSEWGYANCIVRFNSDVPGVGPVNIAFTALHPEITCTAPGSAAVTGYSGLAPYTYAWNTDPPVYDSAVVFTTPGMYTCTVTDALGYSDAVTLLVSAPQWPGNSDLRAHLVEAPFRPGFGSTVLLDAYNAGCVPVAGQLRLVHDTLVTLTAASPAPSLVSGDTLVWDLGELSSDSAHFMPQLFFVTDTAAVIGDSVHFGLTVTLVDGDADSSNNVRSYVFPVVNGYDPNIKSVYPVGKCAPGFISQDQVLTYTVQFQNTGNSEAIHISVVDSLDSDLDLETVRVLGKSHALWTEVLPGHVLKFHFDNIHLPDSTSDEAGSHGYVIFEAGHTGLSLQHGTAISNQAEIYFDFNPAIVTNAVSNHIFADGDLDTYHCSPLGMDEAVTAPIRIFPNPTSGSITVDFGNALQEATLVVTDLYGREVVRELLVNASGGVLDFTPLGSGIYFLVVRDAQGRAIGKSHQLVKTNE